jgi:hypothetical protein
MFGSVGVQMSGRVVSGESRDVGRYFDHVLYVR